MEHKLIDSIRDGDLVAVRRLMATLGAQWQDDGRAVAAEVARSGGPGFTQLLYETESVPSGPWDEIDPVIWAAEHGASELLSSLLFRRAVPQATLRDALDAARSWLDVDPEAELRRRSGMVDDTITVARDYVTAGEYLPRALRIRLTTGDGRRAEVLAEHRAVVTMIEERLNVRVSRDELLARALWSADPESCDWSASRHAITTRFPARETFQWAAGRLADPDAVARRFIAELLHISTLDGDMVDAPYAADALTALRQRMPTETDAETLSSVLGAYAGFSEIGAILYEFLPYATDPRPEVRARVASELLNGGDGPAANPPEHVLMVMLDLARDPDPTVSFSATNTLVHSPIDAPALRELLVSQLTSDDKRIRLEAAAGLALRGDEHALAELRRMSDEDGYESPARGQFDQVERMLGRRTGP